MRDNQWIDLALKYGGFMEQDKIFLRNRLENLQTDEEKIALITPPASVMNAYFAQVYQKHSAKEATDYFFGLSKAFKNFQMSPSFSLEGKPGSENYRFIRLNLEGKSFGFSYKNDKEEAIVFSEFAQKIDIQLLCRIAQIFPQYVVYGEDGKIIMKPLTFKSDFESMEDASPLTSFEENNEFIRLSGYNIEDLIEHADKIGSLKVNMLQYSKQKYSLYISKGF